MEFESSIIRIFFPITRSGRHPGGKDHPTIGKLFHPQRALSQPQSVHLLMVIGIYRKPLNPFRRRRQAGSVPAPPLDRQHNHPARGMGAKGNGWNGTMRRRVDRNGGDEKSVMLPLVYADNIGSISRGEEIDIRQGE